ncbi:MAG: rod shape-determining protein MreC [Verrucomicrobia bacterium]|nr:rod shape-determining protein MreC [Verrucomicrobiota bacterium]MCF7708142.1 rod shape-determining protein MreC [Verrucomicrobiota bacterium]
MHRKPRYLSVIIILLTALILISLPKDFSHKLKLIIGGVFIPLFGVTQSTSQVVDKAVDTALPKSFLISELERLQKENSRLRAQYFQGRTALAENNNLRELLELEKQQPWNLKLAEVVGRDPANWWRTIQIDIGSRDGVRTNYPVLTPGGLVGRISDVGFNRSQVALVGDPQCQVAGMIEETRENGILVPATTDLIDHRYAIMTFLPGTEALKIGQNVITSGMGNVFPKGIVIGQVVDFQVVDFGLYAEAKIKLAVNMNRLEKVWVKFP